MTVCFFSATGNSLYVARRIGGTLLSIPKLIRQENIEIEDDSVGIVSPVYVGGMPLMVQEFLKRQKSGRIISTISSPVATAAHSVRFRRLLTVAACLSDMVLSFEW